VRDLARPIAVSGGGGYLAVLANHERRGSDFLDPALIEVPSICPGQEPPQLGVTNVEQLDNGQGVVRVKVFTVETGQGSRAGTSAMASLLPSASTLVTVAAGTVPRASCMTCAMYRPGAVAMAAPSMTTRPAQPGGQRDDRDDTATRTTGAKATGTPARLSHTGFPSQSLMLPR
jgi:hypothetical protein